MISGILPNIYFPRMDITNVLEGGLRLHNTTLRLELFSKRSFTLSLCCYAAVAEQITEYKNDCE